MCEDIDLFELCKIDFNIEIALNYLREIIKNSSLRSLYFLYKTDKTILETVFDNGNTILHEICEAGKYEDMIKLIVKLNDTLLNKKMTRMRHH